jgi:hypothetical protein
MQGGPKKGGSRAGGSKNPHANTLPLLTIDAPRIILMGAMREKREQIIILALDAAKG